MRVVRVCLTVGQGLLNASKHFDPAVLKSATIKAIGPSERLYCLVPFSFPS